MSEGLLVGAYFGVAVSWREGVSVASAVADGWVLDEAPTVALVERSHPDLRVTGVFEATMAEAVECGDAPDVCAAALPGMSLLFSSRWDYDVPSRFDPAVLAPVPAEPRSALLAGVVQDVGWGGFGLWGPDGRLVRAVSIAGGPVEHELTEAVGAPLVEEEPWWSGDDSGHPQTLVQTVLAARVGFVFEDEGAHPLLVDLEDVPVLTVTTESRIG